jgi:hypothetical protein
MGRTSAKGGRLKLSELTGLDMPREEWSLPYPASKLADPPLTAAEAQAVDLERDTTRCRRHRGEFTHLNVDGKTYFCAAVCISAIRDYPANSSDHSITAGNSEVEWPFVWGSVSLRRPCIGSRRS